MQQSPPDVANGVTDLHKYQCCYANQQLNHVKCIKTDHFG